MRRETVTVQTTWYVSEIDPAIRTDREALAKVLAWADTDCPDAYALVQQPKGAYGLRSEVYLHVDTGDNDPAKVLARLLRFWEDWQKPAGTLWHFRARFAIEHFRDKGYRSDFFAQHALWPALGADPVRTYTRSCVRLDHTPRTKAAVLDAFERWMDAKFPVDPTHTHRHRTVRVTIGEATARVHDPRWEEYWHKNKADRWVRRASDAPSVLAQMDLEI